MKEYKYKINGNTYNVAVGDVEDNIAQVLVNGTPYKVEMEGKTAANIKPVSAPRPAAAPRTATGEKVIAKATPAAGAAAPVKAPLPGTVLSVNVKVGDQVTASTPVVILEAMKMENSIMAGRDGVVKTVSVNPGDAVLEGAELLTIE